MPSTAVRRPVAQRRRRAPVALRSLLCALGAVLATAMPATPAGAVPVGDPFEPVPFGRDPDLTFDPVEARYLLSLWFPSRGGFSSAGALSVAAAGDPGVRRLGGAGLSARTAQIAHDPIRDRFLLAYVEEGTRPEAPPRGVTVVLFAGDGTPLAGPTVIAPAGAVRPQVAHNLRWGEYLVVFGGAAQRISADGAPVGVPTALGVSGSPDVAYRRTSNDYLVVSAGLVVRVSADGRQIGDAQRFDEDLGGAVDAPAIAVRPGGRHAVVTWGGDSGVYARELVGREAIPLRMRQIAPAGGDTAVAYNPRANEYLALWTAPDPDEGPTTILGQHLTRTLREIGPDDFRVSSPVTPPGVAQRDEFAPAVAADTASRRYLAVWNVEFDPVFALYRVVARRLRAVR